MTRKLAEKTFVNLAKNYGWKWHKYGDVRYCIHCRKPLPKSETAPDYMLAPIATWIECKNNAKSGRWEWKFDIGPSGGRKGQRTWLNENGGWLLIQLGRGKAPTGRKVWLLPWRTWLEKEVLLFERNQSSLRLTQTVSYHYTPDELFSGYELVWVDWQTGYKIPKDHKFWESYKVALEYELKRIERLQNE